MLPRAKNKHPDMGFQIAPMIDVVFVIMLFFMVMAGTTKTETELGMKIPGPPSPTPTKVDVDELTVGISAEGAVSLNDQVFAGDTSSDFTALKKQLGLLAQNARNSETKLLVTLDADATAKFDRIAAVLNVLAEAGASGNVTFATNSTGE